MPRPKYHVILDLNGWIRNQQTKWNLLSPAPKGKVENTLLKALSDVTTSLTKVKDEYGKVPWDKWEASVDKTCRTSFEVQAAMEEALAYNLGDLYRCLEDFEKDARKAAKEFKKKSYSGMVEYLNSMVKEAKALGGAFQKYTDERLRFFNMVLKNLVRNEELVCRELVSVAKSLPQDAKKYLKELSNLSDDEDKLKVYANFRTETVRTLSGSLGVYKKMMYPNDSRLEQCRKTFAALGSDNGQPKTTSDIGVKAKQVLTAHGILVKELRNKGLRV